MVKVSRLQVNLPCRKDNLKFIQSELQQQFSDGNYNGTLIIVRSKFGKEFAFYIPSEFWVAYRFRTGKQLGFYWINGDQLVTV